MLRRSAKAGENLWYLMWFGVTWTLSTPVGERQGVIALSCFLKYLLQHTYIIGTQLLLLSLLYYLLSCYVCVSVDLNTNNLSICLFIYFWKNHSYIINKETFIFKVFLTGSRRFKYLSMMTPLLKSNYETRCSYFKAVFYLFFKLEGVDVTLTWH